jgi:hypothetical protein
MADWEKPVSGKNRKKAAKINKILEYVRNNMNLLFYGWFGALKLLQFLGIVNCKCVFDAVVIICYQYTKNQGTTKKPAEISAGFLATKYASYKKY